MTIRLVTVNPVVSAASAYQAADGVGGKLTFAYALGGDNKGVLRGLVLVDQAKQNAALNLVFFSADPATSTLTDNGAVDIADAEALTVIGGVAIAAADYIPFADNSAAIKSGLSVPLEAAATTFYGAMITTGTPTYAAIDDLRLKLYIEV